MAKFLNTSGTNYYVEELIKNAKDRLTLISPYLRINDRIKELLDDKNRLKIDVRIVYGKTDLQSSEMEWLKGLTYIRTSFCKNLHAKCYLNEDTCIITSLNLYEFSQVNNNEMGILIERSNDVALYKDTYEETQRIIRISDEVQMLSQSSGNFESPAPADSNHDLGEAPDDSNALKLTTSKLAKKFEVKSADLLDLLTRKGYLEERNGRPFLSDAGKAIGGEYRKAYGGYFLWPVDIALD